MFGLKIPVKYMATKVRQLIFPSPLFVVVGSGVRDGEKNHDPGETSKDTQQ
jgi:hypothetical protein